MIHQIGSPDGVVCLHGAQSSVVEDRHEEALGEVIQVLPQSKHVVALATGGRVQSPTFHAAAEAAHGGALRQRSSLL